MKPHPRPPIIRKTIKWGGAVVTVLLVVVWVGSQWLPIAYEHRSGWYLTLFRGYLMVMIEQPLPPGVGTSQAGWSFPRMTGSLGWWFYGGSNSASRHLEIPIWIFILPTLAATIVAWRLDTHAARRSRAPLCPKCNYDRTGLAVGAKCPECGSEGVSA